MDFLKNLFKGDKVVWVIFVLLSLVSITEVFSASSSMSYRSGAYWTPISGHLLYLLLGLLVILIVHYIPMKWYGLFVPGIIVAWGLLVAVLLVGVSENGGARWINIAGIHFQPSELAKLTTIATVAFILEKCQNGEKAANPAAFKFILIFTGISLLLIVFDNLSTALLLAATIFLMMIIGHVPWKQIGKLVLFGGVIGSLAFVSLKFTPDPVLEQIPLVNKRATTWKHRLEHFSERDAYISPKDYDIRNNAQRGHANIAIATSGLFGCGPGNSVQRDFLSQAYSDFIYAIVIEELGLLPAAIVALLYIWLLMRIVKIVRQCDRYYLNFLIMGIGFIIAIQAIFNMLVAVDIMPITGQPLPLISKGGTSTLITCVYFGIILGVSRNVAIQKQKRQEEEAEKQRQVQEAAQALLISAAQNLAAAEGTTGTEPQSAPTEQPQDDTEFSLSDEEALKNL